jgi:hypothetical protein
MTKEHSGAWTRTSRIIKARPEGGGSQLGGDQFSLQALELTRSHALRALPDAHGGDVAGDRHDAPSCSTASIHSPEITSRNL